jgi:uncharacterized repeat protein (TIGR02543 family)
MSLASIGLSSIEVNAVKDLDGNDITSSYNDILNASNNYLNSESTTWTIGERTYTNVPIKNWTRSSNYIVVSNITNPASSTWKWARVNTLNKAITAQSSVWDGISTSHTQSTSYLPSGRVTVKNGKLYPAATFNCMISDGDYDKNSMYRLQGTAHIDPTVNLDKKLEAQDATFQTVVDDGNLYIDDNYFLFVYPKELAGKINDNSSDPYYFMNFFVAWGGWTSQHVNNFYGKQAMGFTLYNASSFGQLTMNGHSTVTVNNAGDVIKYGYNLVKNGGYSYSGDYIVDYFISDYNGSGAAYQLMLGISYKLDPFTINYDANGGTGAPDPTVIQEYKTGNISSTIPTRAGYKFKGWGATSNWCSARISYSSTGTARCDGTSSVITSSSWGAGNYTEALNLDSSIEGSITLYAQWEKNRSTLVVNPNGGTWNGYTTTQSYEQEYNTTKSIPVPTRTGYIFKGWTRTNTYGTMTSLTSDATYTFCITDGVTDTITAQWEAITYTVYLHPNRPDSTKRSNDTEKSISAEHNVSYKTVSGWTLDNSTGIYSKTFTYDSTELETPGTFYSLTGWHFDNDSRWYKAQSSSNDGSASGDYYTAKCKNLTTTNNDTINLYPYWVRNTYTIKYDSNTGTTNIFGGTYTTTPTGSTSSTTCYYDTDITLATNGFSRVGYKFIGWSPNPNWGNNQTESTLTGVSSWDTKKATIKSLSYYTKLSESTTSSAIYVDGQKFFKQNLKTTNGTDTITLYAIWEPIRYTVTLHNNRPTDTTRGSTDVGDHSVINNKSDGWNGWSLNSTTGNYTKTFIYDTTVLNSPSTFYSLTGWHLKDYTEAWYNTQGTNGEASNQAYTFSNTTETKINLTTTNGATFNFYPYWVKNSYTITYNSNPKSKTNENIFGNKYTTDPNEENYSIAATSCKYDTNVTITDKQYTREGYIFVGWSLDKDWGTGQTNLDEWTEYRKTNQDKDNYHSTYDYSNSDLFVSGQKLFKPNFTSTDNGSITLYAIWEPITYTIEFNGNQDHSKDTKNPSKSIDSITNVRFDQSVDLPQNTYIRQYEVTLKNAEPWLADDKTYGQSNNGTTNKESKTVSYSFLGWYQGSAIGSAPYYDYTGTVTTKSPATGTSSNTIGVASPNNYQVTSNKDNVLTLIKGTDGTNITKLKNLTKDNNTTVTLYATWKSNTITLPATVSGDKGYTFVDWSDTPYVDTRLYDGKIHNNTDDKDFPVAKDEAYKPYKDITLYAHWYKTATLIFNLNGGTYKDAKSTIKTQGVYYDYEGSYTFGILNNMTQQIKGRYDTQTIIVDDKTVEPSKQIIKQVNAYGTSTTCTENYDSNGINKSYSKISNTGETYRLLGWTYTYNDSVKEAAEPKTDSVTTGTATQGNYSVYDSSHTNQVRITDTTNLYAVWEPILQLDFTLERTLGSLSSSDTTKQSNITAVDNKPLTLTIRPGEQATYSVLVPSELTNLTTTKPTVTVEFDKDSSEKTYSKPDGLSLLAIYDTKSAKWYDNLNPNTTEDLTKDQTSGLNRTFKTNNQIESRTFYIPKYLGTSQSYNTKNQGQNQYHALVTISKPSYYWNNVKKTNEIIKIDCNITLKQSSVTNANPTNPGNNPTNPTTPSTTTPDTDSVLSDFKTIIQ